MKRIICLILTIITAVSVMAMSGCSDFKFNPIGVWRYTDDILYVNGKETKHLRPKDMQYEFTEYIFEKSGTGYIKINGERTISFTYDYSDEEVIMHMTDPFYPEKKTDVKYKLVISDNTKKLIRTVEDQYEEEDGGKIALKEEFVLTKT